MSLIRFQDVWRDGIQSLLGTNPSAQEIIDAYPSAHLIGTDSIQTAGGTFFDLFATSMIIGNKFCGFFSLNSIKLFLFVYPAALKYRKETNFIFSIEFIQVK